MKNLSFRRALLLGALFVPAATAIASAVLQWWTTAAVAGTLLFTVVGLLLLVTLGEIRAVKRHSDRQAKKISHLTKAVSRSRDEVEPVHVAMDKLARTSKTTLARTEQVERRLVGILEALRLEINRSHATPGTRNLEKSIRAALSAFERTLTDETRRLASTTVTKTVTRLTSVARDETRQVEALLQLLPKVDPAAPLPPSGQWAMDARSLLHLSHLCRTLDPKRVVELGGGTSTVWLAYLLQGSATSITSIDHDPRWSRLTRESLDRHGLGGEVALRVGPLEPIELNDEEFTWYQAGIVDDLKEIDFLLIDGPPKASGSFARYPALPALHDHLASSCTVILDDSERPDEVRAVERWLDEFPEFVIVDEGVSRLTVLRRTP